MKQKVFDDLGNVIREYELGADNSLNCSMRYFGKDGRMYSSFSHINLGNISMVDGMEIIKERWREESLPNLVKGHYPSYIYVEMIYGKSSYDSAWILQLESEKTT